MDHETPDSPEAVAVVGLSGRFPGAPDLETFWRNLRGGVESVSTFTAAEMAEDGVHPALAARPEYVPRAGVLDGIERFDARFFGFSPREAELLDPQQRLFLEEAWKALEDAGIDPARPPGRIGVFAGGGLAAYLMDHVAPRRDPLDAAGAYQAAVANDKDFLATRVAYKLDLRGPALTVQTACSTSLVAVCLACQSLMNGECDAALAGGITLRLPHRAGYLHVEEGILSADGHCRAFDAGAQGTVPGSGAGVVVLKRLSDALADGDEVRAVIRGWALNNDGGGKAGYTAPRAEGQEEVIREALALAEVNPATVTYVEAHGTGTRLGDPIEVTALRRAFAGVEPGACLLGSVKTNLGHLDAAAGIAGLVKTVLALQHREIPPTLHFARPSPEIDFGPFRVADRLEEWRSEGPRRAGVSSFGIGGTNAHVVLEEAPPAAAAPAADGEEDHLFVLSAKTPAALEAVTDRLIRRLEALPEGRARDAAFTLLAGRQPLEMRRAVVARGPAAAAQALAAADPRRVWTARAEAGHRPVAFLFPGQGAQHARMAAGLYESGRWPVFRGEMDRCAEILEPHLGLDLRRAILDGGERTEEAGARLARTELAQPALFAVEWALARLWMDWGVQPDALLGHSVGELVAACLAGVFSLEDALAVVAARGRLVQETPPGTMLSVPLAEEALALWLERDPDLALAAVNGPALCVVSGPEGAVARLEAALREEGTESRRLHTSHAFHSPLVDPAVARFREVVAGVDLRPPEIPFLSNVTGDWIRPEEAADPGYWARHLRQPVRFAPAAAALLAEPRRLLLEAGPGTTLTTLLRRGGDARERAVSSLPHPRDPETDVQALLGAAGRLWLSGVPLRAERLHPAGARKVALPTYPFEGERYWIERSERRDTPAAGAVHKRPDPADWLYLPTWKRTLPAASLPPDGAAGEGASWLVVGAGEGLAERLRVRGRSVVLGPPPAGPAAEAEAEALVARWLGSDAAPRRVAFAGAAPALLELVRALAGRVHEPVRLAVVTRGLFDVTGGEASGLGGEVAGLARVIPQEHPGLACRLIDLGGAGDGEEDLEALVDELEAAEGPAPPPAVVALRRGHRWEQAYEPLRLPAAAPPGLAAGSHVVITGGHGRFGGMIGEHLEARGVRVTRLDLREPDGEPDGPGALQVDVADPEALEAALRRAVARHGPIHGVLHAAGERSDDYGILAALRAEDLERHLRPKVGGAAALREALRALGEEPAFCVATSSLAAVLGGVGLGAYAAADAALDALLGAWGPPWASVDWEVWQPLEGVESGAFLAQQQNELMLTPAEVAASLERVLALCGRPLPGGLAVASGDLAARLAQGPQALKAVAGAAGAAHARPESGVPYRAPSDPLEERIAAIWQEHLGVERIGVDDDFFLLGGSSLAGLQILSKMRTELEIELPLKAFFESRTVSAMAAEVQRERARAAHEEQRLAEILAEIEGLSMDEVQAELSQIGEDGGEA